MRFWKKLSLEIKGKMGKNEIKIVHFFPFKRVPSQPFATQKN